MTTTSTNLDARVEEVHASAYEIPTATDKESDGTLEWNSTTLVLVELRCGEYTGLGYTYCDTSAAAVINSKLADIVKLADALPRFHESVPIYGSGGFTSYTPDELREQVEGWMANGFRSVKIKVGRDKQADPERVKLVRSIVGHDVDVMVDGNGAYVPAEALEWAARFREQGVRYFEEPVTSDDLAGMAAVRRGAPPGMAIAAGEYGWNLPYFQRMLDARAVHILQADVTRCGGITNLLRVDGICKGRTLPFSAHCAPAVSAHVCCAVETLAHLEYFHDHVRVESTLFDGVLRPEEGGYLRPDPSRPGLGLELKRAQAEQYAA
jgi:L-alanine-DL-glutamate epimerase-like enolase superfamily enzyme